MIDSESNVEVDQGHMLVLDLWLSTPARNPAHGVEACRRLTRVDPVRKRITILELKTKDIARERLATKSRLHIDFLRFPSIQIDLLP
jgi:hypothetical protein